MSDWVISKNSKQSKHPTENVQNNGRHEKEGVPYKIVKNFTYFAVASHSYYHAKVQTNSDIHSVKTKYKYNQFL